MPTLRTAANVYNTCLAILRERGYTLTYESELNEFGLTDPVSVWEAEKNGFLFSADNPIELLGLTAIYEYKAPTGEANPYWWHVKSPDIYTELVAGADAATENET